MHCHTIAFGLLIGASALRWNCAPEPEQTSPSVESQPRAEFVPNGPVRTEQEAVATAWRYMRTYQQQFLAPPKTVVDGVTYEAIGLVIDSLKSPIVRSDSARWWIGWDLEGDSTIRGEVFFGIDRKTGAVEIAPAL